MTWTVAGQDHALNILRASVKSGRVAHAYLFAGPAHVGKTLTALEFAQTLNCTGDDPPCGRCRQCERIAAGAHPDVEIVGTGGLCNVQGDDHRKDGSRGIRICQVRRLEEVISRAPFEGRYRVQIIDPADALNREAEVALLKTLEEPPPNVVIILIAEQEDELLDTIRSRARRVAFGGMPLEAVERALRNRWNIEPSRAAELARLSGGRLGWAVLALNDERMLTQREEALASAERVASAPLTDRLLFAGEMGGRYSRDRAGVRATLECWQEFWRDILLIAAGREDRALHRDRLDRLRALAVQCDVTAAARGLRGIAELRRQLEENANAILATEMMMLGLPVLRPNPVAARLAEAQAD